MKKENIRATSRAHVPSSADGMIGGDRDHHVVACFRCPVGRFRSWVEKGC